MEIWRSVWSHKLALVFRKPVSRTEAPLYETIIKEPMDLTTLRNLIDQGKVSNYFDFTRQMRLIARNASEFNGEDSEYAGYARELVSFVEREVETELGVVPKSMTLEESDRERRRRAREMARGSGGGSGEDGASESNLDSDIGDAPPPLALRPSSSSQMSVTSTPVPSRSVASASAPSSAAVAAVASTGKKKDPASSSKKRA